VLLALQHLLQQVKALCFGDLHLEDIRAWRESTFCSHYPCRFPIFGVPYPELMARLWAEQDSGAVSVRVSAVREDLQQQQQVRSSSDSSAVEGSALVDSVDVGAQELNESVLRVGAVYDAKFVQQLENRSSSNSSSCSVDLMGEQGEFHTHVTFL
jgi:diphthamide synthase (EF-2-diphthine--ammonia ligase)